MLVLRLFASFWVQPKRKFSFGSSSFEIRADEKGNQRTICEPKLLSYLPDMLLRSVSLAWFCLFSYLLVQARGAFSASCLNPCFKVALLSPASVNSIS